jgi:WD40 repeat protein
MSKIWQAQSGECLLTLDPGEGNSVRVEDVSADGKFLAVTRYDSEKRSTFVEVLDLKTGGHIAKAETESASFLRVRFSPDRTRLAILSGACATVWDVKSGERLATFLHDCESTRPLGSATDNRPFDRSGLHQPFDRDGKRLLTKGEERSVKLWDVATGECLAEFKHPDIPNTKLDSAFFSHDGSKLLTQVSSREQRHHRITKIWNVDTGECLLTLRNDIGRISPDGSKVARLKNGKSLEILEFHFIAYEDE